MTLILVERRSVTELVCCRVRPGPAARSILPHIWLVRGDHNLSNVIEVRPLCAVVVSLWQLRPVAGGEIVGRRYFRAIPSRICTS